MAVVFAIAIGVCMVFDSMHTVRIYVIYVCISRAGKVILIHEAPLRRAFVAVLRKNSFDRELCY